ncbi:hypothetical protein BN2537_2931 [Streptomyces venezuelae]|nr:hypothetical protein BN2537_2931 [Streptomyces venezuelae]
MTASCGPAVSFAGRTYGCVRQLAAVPGSGRERRGEVGPSPCGAGCPVSFVKRSHALSAACSSTTAARSRTSPVGPACSRTPWPVTVHPTGRGEGGAARALDQQVRRPLPHLAAHSQPLDPGDPTSALIANPLVTWPAPSGRLVRLQRALARTEKGSRRRERALSERPLDTCVTSMPVTGARTSGLATVAFDDGKREIATDRSRQRVVLAQHTDKVGQGTLEVAGPAGELALVAEEDPSAAEEGRGGVGVGFESCMGRKGVDVGEQGAPSRPGCRGIPGIGQSGVQLGSGEVSGFVDELGRAAPAALRCGGRPLHGFGLPGWSPVESGPLGRSGGPVVLSHWAHRQQPRAATPPGQPAGTGVRRGPRSIVNQVGLRRGRFT